MLNSIYARWARATTHVLVLIGGLSIFSFAEQKTEMEKLIDSGHNFVMPTDKESAEILKDVEAKGLGDCYKRLYPKGNPIIEKQYPMTMTGNNAFYACSSILENGKIIASLKAQEQKPVAPPSDDEDDVRVEYIEAMKKVRAPGPGAEHDQALNLCESKGFKGLFLMLGATQADVKDFPDHWEPSQTPAQIHKGCLDTITNITAIHKAQ